MIRPGMRFLIVDGDAARASDVRRTLKDAAAGLEVLSAGSLSEYRKILGEGPPDIVLTQSTLPDGRAVDMLSESPENVPFPVLVLADSGEKEAAIEAVARGATDYALNAPPDFRELPCAAARALRVWELLLGKRRAEAAMERQEEKLRSIFSASPMGIGMVVHRVLREVNDAMLRMTGYSREELIGQSSRILYPSDEEFEFVGSEKYRQIADTGTGVVECRWRRKDGGILNVVLASSVLDPDDLGKGVTFTALDITARKRAEDALRESEANFRDLTRQFNFILDALPDNIVRQTSDLRVTWANRCAVEATRAACGIAATEGEHWDPVGKYCYALWHGRSAPCDPCPVLQSFRTGYPALGISSSADGRMWELRTVPVEEDGTVKEVIEIGRDITESRRMEEQLRQVRHMEAVGRLAGGIAHDFNNMLNVILGYSELALDSLAPGSPVARDIGEIVTAGRRSATLIEQLLAFSRRQIVVPKIVRLNEAISEQMNMLQRMIGEDVRIEFRPAGDLGNIKIDPSQVVQILANLAVNARDAIGGVGTVTIETSNFTVDESYRRRHDFALPGRYVMLSVSDTGAGMDAATLEQIFEPFFTTKPAGRGTGLGLSTVYGIVKQNEGFINAYSEPGMGTTFRICFPRVDEEVERAVALPPAALPSGSETILLVEDEEQILAMTAQLLVGRGYRVIPAASPERACLLADQHEGRIHLLLTDVVMPGMNGRELQRRVEQRMPGIRTLFMSGYTEDAIAHRGILDKGVAFIPKPFTLRTLAEKVRAVLDE